MKRVILITLLILVVAAPYGCAQMGQGHMDSGQGMMGSGQGMMGQSQQQTRGNGYYPCQQMMGQGHMGGYGMMGQGHMGGMMGRGGGYGMMGQGHMGGMMGSGMMNGYRGNDPEAYKKYQGEYQKYMDDTAGLRKKLYNKKFEYSEAARNPDATRRSLIKLEKEMMNLQWKINEKAPE